MKNVKGKKRKVGMEERKGKGEKEENREEM